MGSKIDDAMAAARAFADRRHAGPASSASCSSAASRSSRSSRRRTPPRSTRALAEAPALPTGTRVYDAAASGVEMIERAGVAAGSVIVLSDGADYGSVDHAQRAASTTREAAHVRLFGVGLRSRELRPDLAAGAVRPTAGSYVEAAEPEDLAGIYARLADRQAREFLVSLPLAPAARVRRRRRRSASTGISDVVTAAYRTPDFPVPPALPDPPPTWWESGAATTRRWCWRSGCCSRSALWMLLRPLRGSISRRISLLHRRAHDLGRGGRDREGPRAPRGGGRAALASGARGRSSSSTSSWRSSGGRRGGSSVVTVVATVLVAGALLARRLAGARRSSRSLGIPIACACSSATGRRRRGAGSRTSCRTTSRSWPPRCAPGHSFIAALSVMVKDAPEPSRKEFRRVVQDEQLGDLGRAEPRGRRTTACAATTSSTSG